MNNFSGERNRRRLLDLGVFPTFQYNISNFSTSSQTKTEMKNTFEENFFANNLHLIQDPLKKNLAHSVITGEGKKENMGETKKFVAKEPETLQRVNYPFHFGIMGILSGVLNFMGLSQKQSTSPESHYENGYDDRQMASSNWHDPNFEVQNKNERDSNTNMEVEICRLTSQHCEDKVNRTNLFSEFQPFVPKESYIEDDPEDYNIALFDNNCPEYCCPSSYQKQELCITDSPRVKTEILNIHVDIEKTPINTKTELNESMEIEKLRNMDVTQKTQDIASSCEDKMSKLKALLKCRQNKNNESLITDDITKPMDIPSNYSKTVQDTIFGNEIDSSNLTNSFNEVSGKFYSSSVDSEDSFQIVFTDSPQNFERRRISSDCDSEDSFIVFEDTAENCYTSNDVFGDDDSSDSDSIIEDSGIAKLSPSLSRTISDLTDTSLYSEDVVDYAVCDQVEKIKEKCTGLLLKKKCNEDKRERPIKRVHFSTQPPKVHVMRVWAFAARQARAGHWERYALDRERFKRRIADVEMAISWVLKPQHRSRIVFQRFMPWWNAEKRRELAEKEERRKAELKVVDEVSENVNTKSKNMMMKEEIQENGDERDISDDFDDKISDELTGARENENNEATETADPNIQMKTSRLKENKYRTDDL